MRVGKPHLALASAAAAVLALAVTLVVRGAVVDVLVMVLIGAALVGMYLLRRYARAELLYPVTPKPAAQRLALNLARSAPPAARRVPASGTRPAGRR